mgnify:FL=1
MKCGSFEINSGVLCAFLSAASIAETRPASNSSLLGVWVVKWMLKGLEEEDLRNLFLSTVQDNPVVCETCLASCCMCTPRAVTDSPPHHAVVTQKNMSDPAPSEPAVAAAGSEGGKEEEEGPKPRPLDDSLPG